MMLLASALAAAATAGGSVAAGDSSAACNVLDYGAKGDNRTEDTAAVVAALNKCEGGVVLLPRGHTFLLRPIQLLSHTHLQIEGDIQAWGTISTWPVPPAFD